MRTEPPMSITQHDHRERHCPRLGHEVSFAYCRKPGSDTPCGKVLDCWWEGFDVAAFMAGHYADETIEQVLAPPRAKVLSLVELIEQAKQSARSREETDRPLSDPRHPRASPE